jgi:universal stress protein A
MSTPVPALIVLAAVDYSELSLTILQQALAFVRHAPSAELHCLHVSRVSQAEQAPDAGRPELSQWLESWLRDAGQVPESVRVIPHAAYGDVVKLILGTASDLSADLLFVGTHDPKGIDRLLMGSVAEAVVRKASCSVVVVRPKAHAKTPRRDEAPCARCVEVRDHSGRRVYRCEQHAEPHARRHSNCLPRTRTWKRYRFLI